MSLTLYDTRMQAMGILENADRIRYELKLNDLSLAGFRLPDPDAKNALCAMRRYVRIDEDGRDVGLFRIVERSSSPGASGAYTDYTLEHAIATLSDDIIAGQVDMGGEGVTTADVLREILARQSVARWVLGECDFADEFLYTFENDTLLDAVFSVFAGIVDEYEISYDTHVYPFVLHVRRAGSAGTQAIFGRNLTSLTRVERSDQYITRLYCLGNGEGVNQTTIARVNDGLPYLDAETIDPDDPIVGVMIDSKCDDPAALLAQGRQLLARVSQPQVTWTIGAIDLYRASEMLDDDAQPGKVLTVLDPSLPHPLRARITRRSKSDMLGKPGEVTLTISSGDSDAAAALANLAAKQGVHELYSQGMTSMYADSGVDDADEEHAAQLRFYIPDEMRRINRILLSFSLERFRASSKAAAAGGYSVTTTREGGGSTATSESGGSATVSTEATVASNTFSAYAPSDSGGSYIYDTNAADGSVGEHKHRFQHYHRGLVTITIPAQTMTISGHKHNVNVPSHAHTFEVPDHEHDIEYGIYAGPRAESCVLTVDGNIVADVTTDADDLDVTQYLDVDSDGRIRRGSWHEIEILPGSLTRVRWNLFVQMSITARGGGDY